VDSWHGQAAEWKTRIAIFLASCRKSELSWMFGANYVVNPSMIAGFLFQCIHPDFALFCCLAATD
jgi:hypothetical protein